MYGRTRDVCGRATRLTAIRKGLVWEPVKGRVPREVWFRVLRHKVREVDVLVGPAIFVSYLFQQISKIVALAERNAQI